MTQAKTPIEVRDIRKGDRIRTESVSGEPYTDRGTFAAEWIAKADASNASYVSHVQHFLLERPVVETYLKLPNSAWQTWLAGEASSDDRTANEDRLLAKAVREANGDE